MNSIRNISKFHKLSQTERRRTLVSYASLNEDDLIALAGGLTPEDAELFIENVIGRFTLPLGLATHFIINGREVFVPMVLEEPSVVAGVSYAAKLAQAGGGFTTQSSEPIMVGQIQLLDVPNIEEAQAKVQTMEVKLLAAANEHHPTIQELGGGAKSFEYRTFHDTPVGPMLVIQLLFDCRNAMGANAVNTSVEAIAPMIEQATGGRVNLRILSNLSDKRTARAECLIPVDALAKEEWTGDQVAQAIYEGYVLATLDPYRAATHNKGIMNGIDAVALATGNDWRAIEAGAHAYAARNGQYTSLTEWSITSSPVMNEAETGMEEKPHLKGVLEMPLSVGTVGGATKTHPTAQTALKILGQPSARELAEIMAAVGLAQNLAALRALGTEGIQEGHMRLHARKQTMSSE